MAYQNVGTPRFIIDWLQWWKSLGLIRGHQIWNARAIEPIETFTSENEGIVVDNIIGINPTSQTIATDIEDDADGFNYNITGTSNWQLPRPGSSNNDPVFPIEEVNIVGLLGHNFGSFPGLDFTFNFHDGENIENNYINLTNEVTNPISINADPQQQGKNMKFDYNGFTLQSADGTSTGNSPLVGPGSFQPNIRLDPANADNYYTSHFKLGSLLMGKTYELPHSPELSLTMTNEMDGISRSRTKGGSDLVNYRYTKSPLWGDLAPWELHDPVNPLQDQNLSRIGRRSWDLSFNYLSASDLNPVTEGVSKKITDPDAFDNEAGNPIWTSQSGTTSNILQSDDFYSQVIHRTNGGALPFIFQPDSNNSNPDQFAICKFDMNSFVYEQISKGIYNVNLKIREVW